MSTNPGRVTRIEIENGLITDKKKLSLLLTGNFLTISLNML